jgi:hypothetical protein
MRVIRGATYYRIKDAIDGYLALRFAMGQIPVRDHYATLGYVCYAGLANRLRAHLIATELAARSGRSLVVAWPVNWHCPGMFEDIFEYDKRDFYRERRVTVVAPDYGMPDCLNRAAREIRQCQGRFVVLHHTWQHAPSEIVQQCLHRSAGDVFPRALPAIRDAVAAEVAAWTGPMIGVHLRRGDFVSVGRSIPTARYNRAIEAARARCPDAVGIFLATDAAESELTDLVPGLPMRRLTYRGRESREGLASALIDLLVLSHTSYLILTPMSTFGELASLPREIPCLRA